jgi:Zn finger protein HypA/HybF involved in hydrogenase expression
MAQLHGVRCAQCGLKATVSGGRDRGFRFWTETMYCKSCESLSDVLSEYAFDPTHPESFPINGESPELGKCWKCGGHGLVQWRTGQPCPKCGGKMRDTGDFILAD